AGRQAGGAQARSVGDRAGDVERGHPDVHRQRGGEPLQLRQQALREPAAVELARARSYGVSLFSSGGSSWSRSRLDSRPWTSDAGRTPMPKSLMKPAAELWSNWSPRPYVASSIR